MSTTEQADASSTKTTPVRKGANVSRSKNVRWFQSDIGSSLTLAGRQLFEQYSHLKPEDVEPHIYKIRDMAWEIFPWPCVGEFWFVNLGLSLHPQYPALLARLKDQNPPARFLDLGTCLGQDLRKLASDGVPVSALYGSDYFAEYEDAGHQLFRDGERFQNRFIAADIFDTAPDSALEKTMGSWNAVNIIMFLHMYDWPTQVSACKRILKLLIREKGSMVIGAQTGSTEAGETQLKPPMVAEGEERTLFRQSKETFRQMWEEVGKAEGVELAIDIEYDDQQDRDARAKEEQGGSKKKFFSGTRAEATVFYSHNCVNEEVVSIRISPTGDWLFFRFFRPSNGVPERYAVRFYVPLQAHARPSNMQMLSRDLMDCCPKEDALPLAYADPLHVILQ